MFRTEVVQSKNLRKSLFFKIYNAIAILMVLFIFSITFKMYGPDSTMGKFITENYNNIIQPIVMGVALILIMASMYTRNATKSPKRLGSLEIDETTIRYLVDDEVKETLLISDLKSVDFEFFSFAMRGNPRGCMNYLTLKTKDEVKNYEIVIGNTLIKSELGDILKTINKQVAVNVNYAYFLKKLFGDRDFKF
jgi:hypothetical protein